MMSNEAEEVAEGQVMAVSISRPGRSLAANRGARKRASAIRCVFPGVHFTWKLYIATFSHMRCSLGLGRSNRSLRKIPSRGRWSVSTRKEGRPFRKKRTLLDSPYDGYTFQLNGRVSLLRRREAFLSTPHYFDYFFSCAVNFQMTEGITEPKQTRCVCE